MKPIIKKIFLVSLIGSMMFCHNTKKQGLQDNTILGIVYNALFGYRVSTYFNITAKISDSTLNSAINDARVYVSLPESTTKTDILGIFMQTASISTGTGTSTSTNTSDGTNAVTSVFSTSSTTDSNGNFKITIIKGTYKIIVTTKANQSYAFKLKLEADPSSYSGVKATITDASGTIKVEIIGISTTPDGTVPKLPDNFVCGFNTTGDITPPELTTLGLVEATKGGNSLNGAGKVTVKVGVNEPNVGTGTDISGVDSISATFASPNKKTNLTSTLKYSDTSKLYEGTVDIQQYYQNGNWTLSSVNTKDKAGNSRTYRVSASISALNYSMYACGSDVDSGIKAPTFVISGLTPDETAPTISSASLTYKGNSSNPNIPSADLTGTSTGASVSISVGAADETSGSGISYVSVVVQSYSKYSKSTTYKGNEIYAGLSLNSTSGKYEGTVTIQKYHENGKWKIAGIWVSDKAGNGRWYGTNTTDATFVCSTDSTNASKITVPTFTADTGSSSDLVTPSNSKTADFTAPSLISIKADPTTVNSTDIVTSGKPASIKITAVVEDTGGTPPAADSSASGISSIRATFYSPLKLLDSNVGSSQTVTLTKVTPTDPTSTKITYEGTFTLQVYHESGTWKMYTVSTSDNAGNTRTYTLAQIVVIMDDSGNNIATSNSTSTTTSSSSATTTATSTSTTTSSSSSTSSSTSTSNACSVSTASSTTTATSSSTGTSSSSATSSSTSTASATSTSTSSSACVTTTAENFFYYDDTYTSISTEQPTYKDSGISVPTVLKK